MLSTPSHLSVTAPSGHILNRKSGKKPRTTCAMTEKGRQAMAMTEKGRQAMDVYISTLREYLHI